MTLKLLSVMPAAMIAKQFSNLHHNLHSCLFLSLSRRYLSSNNQILLAGDSRSNSKSPVPTSPVHNCFQSRRLSTGNSLKMRFLQFTEGSNGIQRLGVQMSQDGDVIDISGVDSSIPNGLVQLLQGGPDMVDKAKKIAAKSQCILPISSVCVLPPLTAPDKVVCVGLNYRGHCEEQNIPLTKEPMFFSKFSSCIVGPTADVTHPKITTMLDWEVELAVVIGKRAKDVTSDAAMDHVFGYTVAQDISARDWQKSRNGKQWLLGKSMDQFCPLGPAVVVKESVADPHNLAIRCQVNGVVKQNANTGELIHRIERIISFLSCAITLLPGDVILTGTPSGVGMFRNPPEYLKAGDVIESEIEGIGRMRNTIV